MSQTQGLEVASVRPGSLGEELEIERGDKITKINGQDVCDLVDFHFLSSDDYLEIDLLKENGETWQLEVEKEPQEDFGLEFTAVSVEGTKHCRNKCMFCFVDQMPKNLRASLYEKDDDYRLSLTQGSFVTLTNLSDAEFARIVRLHLSPLYISVQATDPEVRQKLLRNPRAGKIMEQLRALADAGIVMHTQIVLVPGINDGEVLDRSIRDLSGLWPQVQSVAVVPVGLTAYRDKLDRLERFDPETAQLIISNGARWQEKFRRDFGVTFVYFSDEFYVEAGVDFPAAENYDDFAQLENGVGLSRLFLDGVDSWLDAVPAEIKPRSIHVVTGVSAGKTITELVQKVTGVVKGLQVSVHALANTFFGASVTVAGLLTGADLLAGLPDVQGQQLLIPRVMLRAGEDVFLDGMTLAEAAGRLGAKISVVELDGKDFLEKLTGQTLKD